MLRRRPAGWRPVPPSAVPALALTSRVLETGASARSAPSTRAPPRRPCRARPASRAPAPAPRSRRSGCRSRWRYRRATPDPARLVRSPRKYGRNGWSRRGSRTQAQRIRRSVRRPWPRTRWPPGSRRRRVPISPRKSRRFRRPRAPHLAATARRYGRNRAPRRARDAAGSCFGSPRVRLPGSEQPRDVTRDRVNFEVHALARHGSIEACVSQGVRDDIDAETEAVDLVYGQADPNERDRALRGDVGHQLGRRLDCKAHRLAVGAPVNKPGDTVDVTGDDMTAELVAGPKRPFEIDRRALFPLGQGRAR